MECSAASLSISAKSSADAGTKPKRMPEVSSFVLMARCFCASSERISLIFLLVWHCFLLELPHMRRLTLFLTVIYKEQSEQHDSKKKDYDR